MLEARANLGQGPGRTGVSQAQGDQWARVGGGGSGMQPVVVLDDSAVADFAVASSQPGDRAFDHRPMPTILGLPFGIAGLAAGSTQQRFVLGEGEFPSADGGGAA